MGGILKFSSFNYGFPQENMQNVYEKRKWKSTKTD